MSIAEKDKEGLYHKDNCKLERKIKKVLLDATDEDIYYKNKNKLDNRCKKVLSDIPVIDTLNKNGNKLDGKYANIIIDILKKKYLIKKKKALGLVRNNLF